MQSRAVEIDAQKAARTVPSEEVVSVHIPLVSGGMRRDKAPGDLAPNEAVSIEGLHIVNGKLVVDTGYIPFGHDYLGIAQKTREVFFNDGTSSLFLWTTKAVFRYEPAVMQWKTLAWVAETVTTAAFVAGDAVITVSVTTNMTLDGLVGIELDDGTQFIATVTNFDVTNVFIDPAIPVGRTVALGAIVSPGVPLDGDPAASQIVTELFAGNEWVIFSNGKDPVKYIEGSVVNDIPGLPANTTCTAIAVFHQSLMLGGMTENGTHLPHRVRGSDAGDPTVWAPGSGIAAVYDLLDTDDEIRVLKILGPYLMAYRADSIMRASYIGAPNEILFWEYMAQNEGAQSQGAVAAVGGEHVFVGKAGVYAYQGGYTLDAIGEAVFKDFLAAEGDFNPVARVTLFIQHVIDLDEVWIFYPHGTSLVPDKMLRVQLENQSWSVREFADPFYSCEPFLPFERTTWASATGEWDDTQWSRPWDSRTLVQNIPSMMLCPTTEGSDDIQLQIYDYRTRTDNGVTIPWSITLRQVEQPLYYTRWERAVVIAQGNNVVAECSINEGHNWIALGEMNFQLSPTVFDRPSRQVVWIDTVSSRLILRLSGETSVFELRELDIVGVKESEW